MQKTNQEKNHKSWARIFFESSLTATLAAVAIFTIAKAGSLTPPSPPTSPEPTSYTLGDIYDRLTTNAEATEANHDISTSAAPTIPTFNSFADIYNAIPTIDANKVATGTEYLGITGTLLGNQWNGTCHYSEDGHSNICPSGEEFPGGSQANGGVDDFNGYNLGAAPPADRYSTTWTQCNSDDYDATENPGGDYCNTNDPGANAKDNATGLVWSYLCKGAGCAQWNTETDPAVLTVGCLPDGNCAYWDDPDTNPAADSYYTWDNSGVPESYSSGNDGKTASELCSQHDGWSLPHQKQLMQAYINGSYGNLEPQGVYRYYWSATTVSYYPTNAWYVNLSVGYTYFYDKTYTSNVRCVRLAN